MHDGRARDVRGGGVAVGVIDLNLAVDVIDDDVAAVHRVQFHRSIERNLNVQAEILAHSARADGDDVVGFLDRKARSADIDAAQTIAPVTVPLAPPPASRAGDTFNDRVLAVVSFHGDAAVHQ